MIFNLLRPALFLLDSEKGHRIGINALSMMPPRKPLAPGKLQVEIAGISFPNPVGLAAGFDKDAEVPAPTQAA